MGLKKEVIKFYMRGFATSLGFISLLSSLVSGVTANESGGVRRAGDFHLDQRFRAQHLDGRIRNSYDGYDYESSILGIQLDSFDRPHERSILYQSMKLLLERSEDEYELSALIVKSQGPPMEVVYLSTPELRAEVLSSFLGEGIQASHQKDNWLGNDLPKASRAYLLHFFPSLGIYYDSNDPLFSSLSAFVAEEMGEREASHYSTNRYFNRLRMYLCWREVHKHLWYAGVFESDLGSALEQRLIKLAANELHYILTETNIRGGGVMESPGGLSQTEKHEILKKFFQDGAFDSEDLAEAHFLFSTLQILVDRLGESLSIKMGLSITSSSAAIHPLFAVLIFPLVALAYAIEADEYKNNRRTALQLLSWTGLESVLDCKGILRTLRSKKDLELARELGF